MGIRSQRGTAALTGRRGRRPLRNGSPRCALVEAACSTLPAAFQKETPSCRMVFLYFPRSAQQNRRGSNSLPGIPRMAEPFAGTLPLPLDLTRFALVEAASSILPAAFQKETPSYPDGVSFCGCPQVLLSHSRTSQGRGSVRGEPLTGSPTRVQSPARRRPLLRSKSAAPKRKTPVRVSFFLEQGTGVEPALTAWEAAVIPIYQPCIHFTGLL